MSAVVRAVLAAVVAVGLSGSVVEAAAPKVLTITVDKMSFGPAPADVHVGDRVRWVNHDIFQHSVTADDHSFELELKPGGQGETVMKHAGVVTYTCRYHPGMKGRIVVKP